MKKFTKLVALCGLLGALVWCGTLLADRQRLDQDLVRLHVVANSDSESDQALKLQVRDAVIDCVGQAMADVADVEQAKAYLQENLDTIRAAAEEVLLRSGVKQNVAVTLCKEAFDTRVYDTFTLPAGVYNALRVTIGEGEGRNWWCVVFPTLCMSGVSEGIGDVAAGAGFPDALTGALTGEEGYELRFYLLDALGRLENLLYEG